MIKVLLAEDHGIVRQGLRALLEQQNDLLVIGEAATGVAVLRLLEQQPPDVALLDLMLPEINGLELTRHLHQHHPGIRALILSMHSHVSYVARALRYGASGYVLKGSHATELIVAIRTVQAGRRYLCAPWDEKTIAPHLSEPAGDPMDLYHRLTGREQEVLSLVAHGLTSVQISTRLFISPRTVEVHRTNFMRKLNLRTHAELLRYALDRGILLAAPSV